MKVANYNIQSHSAYKIEKKEETSEMLNVWTGDNRLGGGQDESYLIDLSGRGNAEKRFQFTAEKTYLKTDGSTEITDDHEYNAKLMLIESFIYMTTGKRVKLESPKLEALTNSGAGAGIPLNIDSNGAVQQREGWGLVYEYHEIYSEAEQIKFASAGSVQLEDGRTIMFDVKFRMSRQFYSENHLNLRLGDAAKVDPLVIDLNGTGPQLTSQKYEFDLDADGSADNISFATGGSGFLALDENRDGAINDGTELFGPQSGNGFKELRAYDLDKNGWIDDNDPIFKMLSVLTIAENDEKMLFKLGEAGVGAIYLHETDTKLEFTDGLVANGEMKSSSIYLKEDGTAGTLHHIDLSI